MEISYFITLDSAFIKQDIPKLDTFWRHTVHGAVREKLTTRPDVYGKPLRRSLRSCRALRVSDYRVVFQIQQKTVHIVAIVHRSTKYKGIDKRL